ncbi:MAG TPA: spondin domain-containing protein [Planctomycetota bacterium]|nr:spondin domain-containing protein [Planctomycetota bacterium]
MRSSTLLVAFHLAAGCLAAQHGTARYQLVFESTWSATTHPVQFPSGPHFSPLTGGTHTNAVDFWLPGALASPGIEAMAELGSTSPLTSEVQNAVNGGTADQVLVFGGLSPSPGQYSTQFTISADFPLFTLVTMLAPSPDWFVGVHGLPLLQNGDWVDSLVVPLIVYDAGTDDGTTYNSPNLEAVPHQPIAQVTTASGPFQGLPGPVATFTFQRLWGTAAYGCSNPDDSLGVAGAARIGQVLTLSFDDPTGQFAAPALTGLALSSAPAAAFPCGTLLPGLGLVPGQPGEVLLQSIDALAAGPLWSGAPAALPLSLPMQTGLVGQRFYLQGLLANSRVAVTNGVSLLIGS